MGMFDIVDYEAPCYKCGASGIEFQSKDHRCTLRKISPRKVRRFYGTCPQCRAWNEYKVKVQSYTVKRVEEHDQ